MNSKDTPKLVSDMTTEEFNDNLLKQFKVFLGESTLNVDNKVGQSDKNQPENLVYGINGIAKLFNCSKPTASKIKKSGKIDQAISQCGRVIVCRADLALELAGKKNGGRK